MHLRSLTLLFCLAACDQTVAGGEPVGGSVDSDAEIQRFLRRAYLDLTGETPSEADLTASTTRLRDANNSASSRGELVGELMDSQDYADVWTEELENKIFAGNTLESHYQLVCGLIRGTASECLSCTATDNCACTCAQIAPLALEREKVATTAADFHGGMATSVLEKRYAMQTGYFAIAGSPEARIAALFDDFLARTPEPDEIENGRALIIGSILPGSPAGVMFHEYGSSYEEMLDIVFESEVYREALVRRVFDRYLARSPSPLELAHFSATLDATTPDARSLVRAVLSSREYFEQ
ncbi:MAG: DUF1549 domain-containing protein [Kofleriaceae bacterium]